VTFASPRLPTSTIIVNRRPAFDLPSTIGSPLAKLRLMHGCKTLTLPRDLTFRLFSSLKSIHNDYRPIHRLATQTLENTINPAPTQSREPSNSAQARQKLRCSHSTKSFQFNSFNHRSSSLVLLCSPPAPCKSATKETRKSAKRQLALHA
jgi:hypothetical protein